MPQATDLVINNGAATPVAKTFSLYNPAAGDNAIAMWKLKEGTISKVFPTITVAARATGNQSRKLQIKMKIPSSYLDAVTGLTAVGSAFEFDASISVPDDYPESLKNDAVAFVANLMNHTLIKQAGRDATPLT